MAIVEKLDIESMILHNYLYSSRMKDLNTSIDHTLTQA